MDKWFHDLPKWAQVILLLIPGVNWVMEILVRWSSFIKKGGAVRLIVSLVVTIFGVAYAWIDAIVVLITNKLLLE